MIKLLRVDDRLIHGMVAVSWTNSVQPDYILVANDAASEDDLAKTTMQLAKPAGVGLVIRNMEESIELLNNPKHINKAFFVITKDVKDAYIICKNVESLKQVNIGTAGVNKKDGLVMTVPQVNMDKEDYDYAKKLNEKGVEVFAQATPSLDRMNYSGIKKAFKEK